MTRDSMVCALAAPFQTSNHPMRVTPGLRVRPRQNTPLSLFDSQANHDGSGTMINGALGTEAPVDVIAFRRGIHWSVAFIAIAQAIATPGLATAVVVGNNIALSIYRVLTRTYPGNRRHFRARWAGGYRTAATGTQKAINGTVTPVFTGCIVPGIWNVAFFRLMMIRTCNRQQR